MNPIQLSHIGIRLVSIYLIAKTFSNIPIVYLTINTYISTNESDPIVSSSFILTLVVPFLFAITLWVIAPKLSIYLEAKENREDTPLSATNFQAPILALIGIYLLVDNTSSAITTNYLLLQTEETLTRYGQTIETLTNAAIAVNLKIIFGLVLLIYSNRLAKHIPISNKPVKRD